MDTQTGRDVLAGWQKDREERDIYKAAAEESMSKNDELKTVVSAEFAKLKAANEEDRAEWKKALSRSRAPGLGVFIGIGYTTQGDVEGVAGVGVVWKLW